ncbi:MAG: hypothetical protein LBV00_03435 [Propionibacteriaceae bacterium]|jgi:PAS domain-containing protein|nr:hypothetical protein [Propionibacteriaceae bacterium]
MGQAISFVTVEDRVPWLRASVDAATRHDWAALSQTLSSNSRDVDDLMVGIGVVVDAPIDGLDDWASELAQTRPEDRLAAVFFAENLLALAWRRRSDQRAANLSAEQISGFRQALLRLERYLLDQLADHPDEASLWATRITSGMGLAVGPAEIARRYRHVAALEPTMYEGARRHLTALFPTWYGTDDDALSFVRSQATGAPQGSTMRALPVEYYAQRWRTEPDDQVKVLLAKPEVRQELVDAAQGSVLSPQHAPSLRDLTIHSNLALLLSLGRWTADAWPHFQALGPYPVWGLWSTLRNPEEAYQHMFDAAQRGAQT